MGGYYSIDKDLLYNVAETLRAHGAASGGNEIPVPALASELEKLVNRNKVPVRIDDVISSSSAIKVLDAEYLPENMQIIVTLQNPFKSAQATIVFYLKSQIAVLEKPPGKAAVKKETLSELADVIRKAVRIETPIPVLEIPSYTKTAVDGIFRPVAFYRQNFASSTGSVSISGTPTYNPDTMKFVARVLLGGVQTQIIIYLM